jgi:hypothetical protein
MNKYDYTAEYFPFNCHWDELINTETLKGNEKMLADSFNKVKVEYDTLKAAMKKDELIKHINSLQETVNELNKQNKEYAKIVKNDNEGLNQFRVGLSENIDANQLEDLFKVKPTFDTSCVKPSNDMPVWFYLAVKYYKHRDLVYNTFRLFGFEVPEWLTQFKLPHEWASKQLLVYLNHMDAHYMTNGKMFDADNIQYWYREQVNGWGSKAGNRIMKPAEQMKHTYSDIPWQFTLRNPRWINNKEVFEALLKTMASKKHNIGYFLEIDQYCPVKMTKEQLIRFTTVIIMNKELKEERVAEFVERNMDRLEISATDPIYKYVMDRQIKNEPASHAAVEVHEYYINSLKDFEQAIHYIEHCKKFDMMKRAEVIKKVYEKFYSNHKIALKSLSELPQ